MNNLLKGTLALALAGTLAGCANIAAKTDLAMVAKDSGLTNVTTGDGTFENYTATGHYSSTEIGIAVGLPFLAKFIELYPTSPNEAHMTYIGKAAKEDGATAMINANPPKSFYTGFPFVILGLYIDKTDGTGIKVK